MSPSIDPDRSINVKQRIETLEGRALNRILAGMFLLALAGAPISISRVLYTGWQATYAVHLIALCLVGALFFIGERLSNTVRAWLLFTMSFVVTVAGLLNYGVVGNGMLWFMITLMLALFFIGNRTAAIASVVLLVPFVISLYQFVYAGKPFPGDANIYLASLPSWGTAFFGAAIFVAFISVVVAYKRKQAHELIAELEQRNITIEQQKQQIEHRANHDPLTGLPTLRLADDRLEMAIRLAKREDRKAALLFLDLDGFKAVNDHHSHEAGDTVLREIANRLLATIRASDTACRIGGDEFLIIAGGIDNSDEVGRICTRLIKTIGAPLSVGDTEVTVGVSIGAAIYPDHATDGASMRRKADVAMYRVKRTGKNNYQVGTSACE